MAIHELLHKHKCNLCRIEMEHVSVHRGGQTLLSDVDLHIHCGELTALLGPNGAGKTTFLKALMGIIPREGSIVHLNEEGKELSSVRVGYVPQHLDMDRDSPVSVLDMVTSATSRFPAWLGSTKATRRRAEELLRVTDCERLAKRRVGELSGGELQRVLLAMALSPMPDLLVLDEPVSGMDQNGVDMFYDMVSDLRRSHHMAILLVSHDFTMIRRHADRAVLLHNRVLCDGTPDEVFASPEFEKVFGRAI